MKIAVVPGDGIGKEVMPAALSVLDAFGLEIEKVPLEIGYGKWEKTGSAITDDDIALIRECDCVLFGLLQLLLTPIIRVFLCDFAKNLTFMPISALLSRSGM